MAYTNFKSSLLRNTTLTLTLMLIACSLPLSSPTPTSPGPNPELTARQNLTGLTCECPSPSGCPGRCVVGSNGVPSCSNYCSTGTVLPCGACHEGGPRECIFNFMEGTCFTIA